MDKSEWLAGELKRFLEEWFVEYFTKYLFSESTGRSLPPGYTAKPHTYILGDWIVSVDGRESYRVDSKGKWSALPGKKPVTTRAAIGGGWCNV